MSILAKCTSSPSFVRRCPIERCVCSQVCPFRNTRPQTCIRGQGQLFKSHGNFSVLDSCLHKAAFGSFRSSLNCHHYHSTTIITQRPLLLNHFKTCEESVRGCAGHQFAGEENSRRAVLYTASHIYISGAAPMPITDRLRGVVILDAIDERKSLTSRTFLDRRSETWSSKC